MTITSERVSSNITETCAIEIENLVYSYPDGWQAIKGVNLKIAPGEKIAIVGPNGAGKSTMLLHLNGLLEGNGKINVLGRALKNADNKTIQQIRALVGVVFQDPDDQLFSPTVYEDVAFGPIYMGLSPSDVDSRVEKALADVGLEGYGNRMPIHLSGGEKKRAAIATVLSMGPEILALDEPSAGLDPRARRGLIQLLDRLTQTIIITTHDMHMCKEIFPRMVIMDGGIVVADGPTNEILSNRDLLEAHGLELP
jgi:cobalt transport protein ATP-binding subunit